MTFFTAGLQPPMLKPSECWRRRRRLRSRSSVYTGPTKTGAALIAAVAVDAEKQTPRRGKKGARRRQKAGSTADAKTDAKSAQGRQSRGQTVARHASAKPDTAAAKPADKPAASGGQTGQAQGRDQPAPKSTRSQAGTDQKTAAPRS